MRVRPAHRTYDQPGGRRRRAEQRQRRHEVLTFAHDTRSFVASDSALRTGCSMTSSGRSMRAAYSMNAKPVLQPDVSRRRRMYSSSSGMSRPVRSAACCMMAWKYVSSVDMRRCRQPGPADSSMRSHHLETEEGKNKKTGHVSSPIPHAPRNTMRKRRHSRLRQPVCDSV